jgi:uncharacterized protein YciI
MPTFAVTLESGPNWDHGRGRREQDAWEAHAAFMDLLLADGFLIIGGPLGDAEGRYTMHAIEAPDEEAVRTRFAEDPWAPMGLLRIARIEPWALWLDGRR